MADLPTPEMMNSWTEGKLPGLLGITITAVDRGRVSGRLPVRPEFIAGNNALWAPAIVGLADTCALTA